MAAIKNSVSEDRKPLSLNVSVWGAAGVGKRSLLERVSTSSSLHPLWIASALLTAIRTALLWSYPFGTTAHG